MTRGRPRYPDTLTPREQEVLELLREGLTNPEIARRLGISLDGAKYHVSEILAKLEVGSREEAANWTPAQRTFGLGMFGALAQKVSAAGVMKVSTAGLLVGGVAVVALIAIGVLVMDARSDDDPATSHAELPLTPSGEPSPLLALLDKFPAQEAGVSFLFNDYERARDL